MSLRAFSSLSLRAEGVAISLGLLQHYVLRNDEKGSIPHNDEREGNT